MLKVNELGMTGTMLDFFNIVGKAIGLKDKELKSWSIERSGKSRPYKDDSFCLTIIGRESNKQLEPDKTNLLSETIWIYVSFVDDEGKEDWILKTFHNISSAHDYYIEVSKRDDLIELMIFLNGKQQKSNEFGFWIY